MIYLLMCGGLYPHWQEPKHLQKIHGEPIVARTIRLLRESGIENIAITSNDDRFKQFGVPVLEHDNTYVYGKVHTWLDAFYPLDRAVCYIFGDVVFSPEAIKTIVKYQTDSIMFFGSSEPVPENYPKRWAEPFAFKVMDQKLFRAAITLTKHYDKLGKFHREPVSWELWQVIQGTPLDVIDYTNYVAINDYTCDIDTPEDIELMERLAT